MMHQPAFNTTNHDALGLGFRRRLRFSCTSLLRLRGFLGLGNQILHLADNQNDESEMRQQFFKQLKVRFVQVERVFQIQNLRPLKHLHQRRICLLGLIGSEERQPLCDRLSEVILVTLQFIAVEITDLTVKIQLDSHANTLRF